MNPAVQPQPYQQPPPVPRPYYVSWIPTDEFMTNSDNQLLCPSCVKPYVNRQINQCADGHLFCNQCFHHLHNQHCPNPRCPVLVRRRDPIRNRQLEHVVDDMPQILQETEVTRVVDPDQIIRSRAPLPPLSGSAAADRTVAPNNPVVTTMSCANCKYNLRENGLRYRCLTCPNYYLCTTCSDYGNHKEHPMVLLNTAGSLEKCDKLMEFCRQNQNNSRPTAPARLERRRRRRRNPSHIQPRPPRRRRRVQVRSPRPAPPH